MDRLNMNNNIEAVAMIRNENGKFVEIPTIGDRKIITGFKYNNVLYQSMDEVQRQQNLDRIEENLKIEFHNVFDGLLAGNYDDIIGDGDITTLAYKLSEDIVWELMKGGKHFNNMLRDLKDLQETLSSKK